MIKIYERLADSLTIREITEIKSGAWLNLVSPTEEEIKIICERMNITDVLIRSMLDEEEVAHIDTDGNQKLIVVDLPVEDMKRRHLMIYTAPLGIIIVKNETEEFVITVSLTENQILGAFKNDKIKDFYTNKKSRFTIILLHNIAKSYIKYLKMLDKEIEKVEDKLYKSTNNKSLLQLMDYQKSLVYVSQALSSNQAVLERLSSGNTLDMYEEDKAILEDALIDSRQAMEMAKIYTGILNGMIDSFATIISNNLNSIMKLMAGVTIVISIPTMIASFLGMNVPLGILSNSEFAFLAVILSSLILSLIVAIILRRNNML